MEKYKELEMEIIEFQSEDIIVTSCPADSHGPDYCWEEPPCAQVA